MEALEMNVQTFAHTYKMKQANLPVLVKIHGVNVTKTPSDWYETLKSDFDIPFSADFTVEEVLKEEIQEPSQEVQESRLPALQDNIDNAVVKQSGKSKLLN